ncbi:growth hormone secretagogue receptor type 1-like [Gigantopelta aegis]|uniref:growth hormone secretagogue receptor type 1-like n=1 Tax=Gigantopelta aegis TaxID=1735272 RepID=UPI001B88AC3C|nr:growth hormone secretagogue receptor type 1-like [Gigantopelta aegis]
MILMLPSMTTSGGDDLTQLYLNSSETTDVLHPTNSSGDYPTTQSTSTSMSSNDTQTYPDNDNVTSTPSSTAATSTTEGAIGVFRKVEYVLIPVWFVVGIVGNTLSVVIMLTKEFRVLTSSLIIICLSVSDSAVLIMQPFQSKLFSDLFGFDIRSLSNVICVVFSVLWRTAKSSSAWLVVLISVERLLAVCLPLHVKFICTRRNTKLVIGLIYVSVLAFSTAWSLSSRISNDGFCVFNYVGQGVDIATVQAMLISGTIICGMLPTCILPLTTLVILCRLQQIRRKRRTLMNDQIVGAREQTSKIAAMLMSVPIAFVILASPTWIGHNAGFVLGENFLSSKMLTTWRYVAQPLEQMNYSINVFLYITCSRMYRKRLVALIRQTKKSSSTDALQSVSTSRF